MAKWSRAQIEVMARAVGWGSHSADVSWVAMAESGGDDKAVNSIGCVGLLQINQPVHVGSHPKWTRAWLQNPMNNLAAGLVLFKAAGSKFGGPWLDSRNKGALPEGWGPHVKGGTASQTGLDDLPGVPQPGDDSLGDLLTPDISPLTDVATQMGRIAQATAKAANWLADPFNWLRIAYVTGGGVLVLVAVNAVVRPPTERAVRTVAATLPKFPK